MCCVVCVCVCVCVFVFLRHVIVSYIAYIVV